MGSRGPAGFGTSDSLERAVPARGADRSGFQQRHGLPTTPVDGLRSEPIAEQSGRQRFYPIDPNRHRPGIESDTELRLNRHSCSGRSDHETDLCPTAHSLSQGDPRITPLQGEAVYLEKSPDILPARDRWLTHCVRGGRRPGPSLDQCGSRPGSVPSKSHRRISSIRKGSPHAR